MSDTYLIDPNTVERVRYPDSKNKRSIEEGDQFEDYVRSILARQLGWSLSSHKSKGFQFVHGETVQGFEFKLDKRCTEFQRLSIEIAEKSSADRFAYTWSGIWRPDNTRFYVQGNFHTFWVFSKRLLQSAYLTKTIPGRHGVTPRRYSNLVEQTISALPSGGDSRTFEHKVAPTLFAFYIPFDWADACAERFEK